VVGRRSIAFTAGSYFAAFTAGSGFLLVAGTTLLSLSATPAFAGPEGAVVTGGQV